MRDFIRKNIAVEKLSDYASRAALTDECTEETVRQCVRIIESIPGVDASPVAHGSWVEYNSADIDEKAWTCSVCGLLSYAFMFGRQIAKYCPHCGAKMDLE